MQTPLKLTTHFYFWLHWVFVAVRGLSLVAVPGLLIAEPGLWVQGLTVIVAQRLNSPAAGGILPDQGSNPCPLRWQADFHPLDYQGSPCLSIFFSFKEFIVLLKDNCITEFCCFLSDINMNQP